MLVWQDTSGWLIKVRSLTVLEGARRHFKKDVGRKYGEGEKHGKDNGHEGENKKRGGKRKRNKAKLGGKRRREKKRNIRKRVKDHTGTRKSNSNRTCILFDL